MPGGGASDHDVRGKAPPLQNPLPDAMPIRGPTKLMSDARASHVNARNTSAAMAEKRT